MSEEQCDLRRKLRAQARQLGDQESKTQKGAYGIRHLVEKLAYDQWHRILFARFLLENNLLISPDHGVPVTLPDCEELCASLNLKDGWAVAARFAAEELPDIFRADDPAGSVELAPEDRKKLIEPVMGLPREVFTASDSLGWCYQFWQAERKNEVNASGIKIGADELPAVTQLFTEDYMVDFLLDNTLGAWYAGKTLEKRPNLAESLQTEEELRSAIALPGCAWKYLRFVREHDRRWQPAAGTFERWPKAAKDLKCLDPCMGSGHFLVAMFERLVALRISEEGLSERQSVLAAMSDNLFGLEIDPRCTQIAAFNLALAAWRRVGYCRLPEMNLACSGLAPNSSRDAWLALAGNKSRLRNGMDHLYDLFTDAPILGTLIDPGRAQGNLLVSAFHELLPMWDELLAKENKEETTHEMTITGRGVAKAAQILSNNFTLVATNVPFKETKQLVAPLQNHIRHHFAAGGVNLATAFVLRIKALLTSDGTAALVTPHEWLFLKSYEATRRNLLATCRWEVLADLGEHAFESAQAAGAFIALIAFSNRPPLDSDSYAGFDAIKSRTPREKAQFLSEGAPFSVPQADQLRKPDARIGLSEASVLPLLSKYAGSYVGLQNGDTPRFVGVFWELPDKNDTWELFQLPCDTPKDFGGREGIVRWENGDGELAKSELARIQGTEAWGKSGVAIRQTRTLPATRYTGDLYDQSSAAIVPFDARHLPAIWTYCDSGQFHEDVRKIDKKKNVTNATMVKVPFDLKRWQAAAAEKYPHGLPKPASTDPTQWLFSGNPKDSGQPLHVAVARLLGYQWPRQAGYKIPDCPPLGLDSVESTGERDSIVCLHASPGETPGAERLRAVLVKGLGEVEINTLISSAGPKGSRSETLEGWLREEFFEQHCAIFHNRPFIWHIWDGHKSGFSVLLNYHKLTHSILEKLIYAYLGDWIRRQQAAADAGDSGSDARLQAAKQLQVRLKLILEGEPPYDIFVRWKPLSRQSIGWQPDLNDGVRLNIRPFVNADALRKRINIKWDKDRGKEPHRAKKDFPWFWGWDEGKQDFAGGRNFDGNRWNDCHYTNEFKRKARES